MVETTVHAPVKKVWEYWTMPEHIVEWNQASAKWHSPRASNDLVPGGEFVVRMESKDGTMGFDFGGIYDEVEAYRKIAYTMADGPKVRVDFSDAGTHTTKVTERFDAEDEHSIELQRQGWQSILDNFTLYVHSY
jgi:uncharacterized protein YndB with AHSA1/START domain